MRFRETSAVNSVSRVLAAGLLTALSALAQDGPGAGGRVYAPAEYDALRETRIVRAVRISEEITFDGRLDEPAWDLAEPATDFIQQTPRPGAIATERTEVRFLYDADNLYVGYICFDSDIENLSVSDLREDFNFQVGDVVSLIVDGLRDRRSGFAFSFNPAGARRDAQISNDGQSNFDWDGVWDVRTARNGEAWFAEVIVPFKTLRFSSAEIQEWGVNMTRRIPRRNEEANWSPVPIRFRGTRVSMAGALQGLENLSPGVNLKVKPFLTAGVTQVRGVESLETTRSLSRLRDYDAGLDLKYSLTPSLTLDATYHTDFAQVEADQQQVNLTRFNLFFPEKREFFLENAGTFNFGPGGNLLPFFSRTIGLTRGGDVIPIAGGARVSGQINRYDVGFLTMKTEAAPTRQGREPANTYLIGRLKRNLFQTSWIGAIVTSRSSALGGDHNRVYGADARFLFYDSLEFDSYVLKSETPELSGEDQARRLAAAWRGDELHLSVQYSAVEENFNPEVGFVRRGDMSQYAGDFTWTPLLNDDRVRSLTFGTSVEYVESVSGEIETRTQDARAGINFQNSASASFTVTRSFERLTEVDRIQGIQIPAGDYGFQAYSASFRSDPSRRVSGNVGLNWGDFWNGTRRSWNAAVNVRPDYHLSMDFTYNRNRIQLSRQPAKSDLYGARFLYAFTSRSFLNAFFQYNSSTREISSNIRFNVMYRPLSDIYVVYNDRRDARGNVPLERAFIVKVTRLINF